MFESAKISLAQVAPSDSPSDIAFNPCYSYFSVTSWDGSLRLYTTSLEHKLFFQEQKPILTTTFDSAGTICFAGTSEGKINCYDLNTSKSFKIEAHTNAVKKVLFYNNLLISGSFDKTVRFFDLRTNAPVHTLNLPERLYSMDLGKDTLVCSMATNKISTFDLKNNCAEKTVISKLFWQIRSVHLKEDDDTLLIGGVEGKLEILSKASLKSVIMKLHRNKDDVFPINFTTSIPKKNIVVSGGGDNRLIFFDKNSQQKMLDKSFDSPLTCGAFNSTGDLFAFGLGYDWSRGYEPTTMPNGIGIVNCAGM